MKRAVLAVVVLAMGFFTWSCASEGYNTQKGAAIGAAVGALAGQAIGRNTVGTLIGAGAGALTGAIAGNAVDQDRTNRQAEATRRAPVYAASDNSVQEAPPGEWVMVPGQWVGGRWVPAHKQWVPVNPR
jgi:surface antigen